MSSSGEENDGENDEENGVLTKISRFLASLAMLELQTVGGLMLIGGGLFVFFGIVLSIFPNSNVNGFNIIVLAVGIPLFVGGLILSLIAKKYDE